MNQNSIMVFKPYKWEGMWVFDDETTGLVREPFSTWGKDQNRGLARFPWRSRGRRSGWTVGWELLGHARQARYDHCPGRLSSRS